MKKIGCSAHDIWGSCLYDNLKYISEAGFNSVFFLWHDDFDTKEAMNTAEKYGLCTETLHAPFVSYNSIWEEGNEGDCATEAIRRCIWAAAEYGIPTVVSHTVSDVVPPLTSNIGLCRFGKLVVEAEKYNVKLAFENTEYVRHLALVLDSFKSEMTGFCYDVGHEHAFTPGIRCMPMFGHRLFALHLHDNLGIGKSLEASHDDDLHRIPFHGNIDWTLTLSEIKSSGFDGTLMLECDPSHDLGLYKDITAKEYYIRCAEAAVKLAELWEKL